MKTSMFLSREQMPTLYHNCTVPFAVISVVNSCDSPFTFERYHFELQLNSNCKGILRLFFDDICSLSNLSQPKYHVLFDDQMAEQVDTFVEKQKDVIDILFVHCSAGMSRSAAIAQFAATKYSAELIDGKQHRAFSPNQLVKKKLTQYLK